MARKLLSAITFTVTVLLFLFALANARAPLDQPRNDVSTHDLLDSVSRITNTILLPSERPDTDPATVVELEPETINEPKQPQPEKTTAEFEIKEAAESEETATEEPQMATLTMISFRPINRPRRPSLLPFRQHRRGCHHQRTFKPWGPRREISYGNDMILSSERGEEGPRENMRPRREIFYGKSTERDEKGRQENMGRRTPERQWAGRFQNQGGSRFWVVRGDDMAAGRDEKLKMFRNRRHPYLLRFHRPRFGEDKKESEGRDHGHHHIHKHEHTHKHEEEKEGGIFRGIRKFLYSHF